MGDPYSSNLSGEGQSLGTTALQSSGGNLTLISSLRAPYQIFLDKTVRFTCLNRRCTGQESLLGNLTGAKKTVTCRQLILNTREISSQIFTCGDTFSLSGRNLY